MATKTMYLNEALSIIQNIPGIHFDILFEKYPDIFKNFDINKGKTGQILQKYILGLDLDSKRLDFIDGELKTIGWYKSRNLPKETMDITKLNEDLDDFLLGTPYKESHVYQKMKNVILVPAMGYANSSSSSRFNPKDRYFLAPIHINENMLQYKEFYEQLEKDYYTIQQTLVNELDNGGYIHTINGKYLQIRPHDSIKKIVFSKVYNRIITKDELSYTYGFYLKKDGIKAILKINPVEDIG